MSSAIRELDWKGDSGLSRRVAEISASMIWPGVISMGIPRSGVGGRGGVVGRDRREPRLESDTGEVGRLTVTGTLELRVRLKQKRCFSIEHCAGHWVVKRRVGRGVLLLVSGDGGSVSKGAG